MGENMEEKRQSNFRLSLEVRGMLKQLADADLRTLTHELEFLIRGAHARRQQPRTLVDKSGRYEYEKEVTE